MTHQSSKVGSARLMMPLLLLLLFGAISAAAVDHQVQQA
jgi:hypothetical protein